MKCVLLVTALLITLLVPSLAYAQDSGELRCSEEDLQAGIQEAIAGLQEAEGLIGTEALNQVDQTAAGLNLLSYQCRNVSDAQGTRSNPIPLGEYYEFEGGLIRIVSLIDPYEPSETLYGIEEGYRIVAFEMEYLCQLEDPDISCKGDNFYVSTAISREGVVYDTSFVFGGADPFEEKEVFGGNTIVGYQYLQIPEGQDFALVRFLDRFSYDEIYFSVETGE